VIPSPIGSTCYEGDNRGFDSKLDASSRAAVEMTLLITGRDMQIEQSKKTIGPSKNVDCKTGENLESPKSASESSITIGEVKTQTFFRTVFIRVAAGNPFFSIAPDIDFSVSISYDNLHRSVSVKGSAGYFPSFEAYYRLNGGPVKTIVAWPPYGDTSAWSLIDLATGVNTRSFQEAITL